MSKIFLTAKWENLIMANYVCNEDILLPYLPPNTELDLFHGKCYVSLVGLLFLNTKVLGISFPFHKNFVEINLRFYVWFKENNNWKRGVVFIKEIVPKFMITTIANTFYNEKYETHKTKYNILNQKDTFELTYTWKGKRNWNSMVVNVKNETKKIQPDSEESFITEHYWGYTTQRDNRTMEYAVEHPSWEVYPIEHYSIKCDFKELY